MSNRTNLKAESIEEIIKLAWADTVPFETIRIEYGLSESEVRKLMRQHQTEKTYVRWRMRVEARSGTSSKHEKLSYKTSSRMKD